jgi:GDP-L-fucose synthase
MDYVFHLAAVGWGLPENMRNQPRLFTENVLLNTTLLDAAYQAGVERYLYTSSSAVYPAQIEEADEAAAWDAPPHPSEECFGWSKRIAEIQCQAYARHYAMKIAIVRPSNPYGPGDTFDPARSHVIPSLIMRALSEEDRFVVWGSGTAVRSFVYVTDVASIMMAALERHPACDPVNIASTETTSIGAVARLVLDLCGRPDTEIEFDKRKPDGHPRKVPCVRRAAEILGVTEYIPLREGLRRTIEWYLQNRKP